MGGYCPIRVIESTAMSHGCRGHREIHDEKEAADGETDRTNCRGFPFSSARVGCKIFIWGRSQRSNYARLRIVWIEFGVGFSRTRGRNDRRAETRGEKFLNAK